jgi:UMF1 family MFS transporter
VVFGRVFTNTIATTPEEGNSLWALSLALANFVSLLAGPILGGWVDAGMGKRRPLIASWAACCVLTVSLGAFGRGDVLSALVVVTAANIAFCLGENLIASFLPELAPLRRSDVFPPAGGRRAISAVSFSLVVALVLVQYGEGDRVPAATAVFFFVAGLPTVVWLKDRGRVVAGPLPSIGDAFATLRNTWAERRRYPDLRTLLVALFLVQGGVSLVIGFSAIFATEALALPESETILLFIVIQLAAALGAVVFGRWQDRRGSRWALLATTLLWIVATVLSLLSGTDLMRTLAAGLPTGMFAEDPVGAARRLVFWTGALLAGAAMGSQPVRGTRDGRTSCAPGSRSRSGSGC